MIFLCVFVLCGNANKKPFPHFYWKAFLQPLYTKAVFCVRTAIIAACHRQERLMPLKFQPRERSVIMCDFRGYEEPEMVKKRPVVVIARNRHNDW